MNFVTAWLLVVKSVVHIFSGGATGAWGEAFSPKNICLPPQAHFAPKIISKCVKINPNIPISVYKCQSFACFVHIFYIFPRTFLLAPPLPSQKCWCWNHHCIYAPNIYNFSSNKSPCFSYHFQNPNFKRTSDHMWATTN